MTAIRALYGNIGSCTVTAGLFAIGYFFYSEARKAESDPASTQPAAPTDPLPELRVEPVSTAEFPRPAKRPPYAALTTVQEPRILLPPWREGLAAFVAAISKEGAL